VANKVVASIGGIGVCGALGVAFVMLKLCGVLGWSWWWVLAPFWMPPVAGMAVLAAVFAGAAATAFARKSLSGGAGAGVRRLPLPVYEPVHGWTKPQRDDYLARNPAYRSAYEARLRERG
jgi:hypothetical protein